MILDPDKFQKILSCKSGNKKFLNLIAKNKDKVRSLLTKEELLEVEETLKLRRMQKEARKG